MTNAMFMAQSLLPVASFGLSARSLPSSRSEGTMTGGQRMAPAGVDHQPRQWEPRACREDMNQASLKRVLEMRHAKICVADLSPLDGKSSKARRSSKGRKQRCMQSMAALLEKTRELVLTAGAEENEVVSRSKRMRSSVPQKCDNDAYVKRKGDMDDETDGEGGSVGDEENVAEPSNVKRGRSGYSTSETSHAPSPIKKRSPKFRRCVRSLSSSSSTSVDDTDSDATAMEVDDIDYDRKPPSIASSPLASLTAQRRFTFNHLLTTTAPATANSSTATTPRSSRASSPFEPIVFKDEVFQAEPMNDFLATLATEHGPEAVVSMLRGAMWEATWSSSSSDASSCDESGTDEEDYSTDGEVASTSSSCAARESRRVEGGVSSVKPLVPGPARR